MKVLAVDDESKILRLLQFNLEIEGIECVTVSDSTKFERAVEEERPDVVILDVMMPGLNGYQLAKILKADSTTAHIPIIMLTAKAQYEDVLNAYKNYRIDYYITKPFTFDQIVKGLGLVA